MVKFIYFIKKIFARLSIRNKITISMIMISTLPIILIGSIASQKILSIIDSQSFVYSKNVLKQYISRIEKMVDEVSNVSVQIMLKPEIQYFTENAFDDVEYIIRTKAIEQYLHVAINNSAYISSIFLCMNKGTNTIITSNNLGEYEKDNYKKFMVYEKGINAGEIINWTGVHENEFKRDSDENNKFVLTLSRALYSDEVSKPYGALVINIPDKNIRDIYDSGMVGKNDSLYIIDPTGLVLFSPDRSNLLQTLDKTYIEKILKSKNKEENFMVNIKGAKKYVSYEYSEKTKWIYITELDINDLLKQSTDIRNISIMVVVISVVVSTLLSLLLAISLTNPIKELINSMRKAEKADFDSLVEIHTQDEIGILASTYNKMIQEIKTLLERVKTESKLKQQSELNTLQAQITPHFIYNFLNTIKSISCVYEDKKVYNLSTGLIELLQTSISKRIVFITVEEELNLVKSYLYLQQIRYEDKFKVVYEIDEEVLKYKTLKMLLQPIAENVLIHGIEIEKGNGIIIIRAYKKNAILYFEVEDNGRGIAKEQIQSILSNEHKSSKGKFSGIGVKNVKDRITLYFGENYTIQYKSKLGYGTRVIISLPTIADESESELYV